MKKWFFILLTAFILTGCAKNTQNVTSQSTTITETDIQANGITNIFPNESSKDTRSNNTDDLIQSDMAHEYFCDKFMLTVNDKQYDLTTIVPELSSVSELYPITEEHLYILGRIDENQNSLIIYDFTKEEFIFTEHGSTMCWVQNKFDTVRYLKDNVVYDFAGNVVYQTDESKLISMIEYVVEDFKVTVTDSEYETPEEIWIE